ncbi:threonine transporter [Herbaspirillum hiltneri N3]|uniref:Threonine transporter n=1 Tax=Herbaspirillum hiltneri N3 TaxID=1262470 RepID=A0ABM5UWP7_9BURK|nr:LysE family translocator [Herbaspirillum hiltneri]AKZ61620.1 threonine transporter [Herbaspirillum hiltneri N3]
MVMQEFAMLAAAHWLALVSPGPDFLLLLRSALRHGRRNGIGASLGIACANGVYIALALAGFSLLQRSPAALTVMKLLAAAYLAYIGWSFMQAGRAAPPVMAGEGAGMERGGFLRGFVAGFLSGGLNPKNGLFYLGLFTLMVGAGTGMHIKLWYGLWMFTAVFVWDAGLVLAVSNARVAGWIARYFARAEWLAGVILLLGGTMLAMTVVLAV